MNKAIGLRAARERVVSSRIPTNSPAGYRMEALESRVLLASISGTIWNDLNGNRAIDSGEDAIAGRTVYLDSNHNSALDNGEQSTTTNNLGVYAFTGLSEGTYYVAEVLPAGWEQTSPTPYHRGFTSTEGTGSRPVTLTTTGSTASVDVQGEVVTDPKVSPSDVQASPLIHLPELKADPRFSGVDGTGYSVAILDTGIDEDHPHFGSDLDHNGIADRIVYQQDFADGDMDASDHDGHGSNVTDIAAGSDSLSYGMAPGANIIALKVFQDTGPGNFSYVEAALQWVVNHASEYHIAAVNMSLGDSQNYNTPTQQVAYGISDELAQLAAQRVIVVSANGNDYYTNQAQGVAYPAADPNSLAVGSVDDNDFGPLFGNGAFDQTSGPDRVTGFSQRSTTMTDIFAPGAVITGANATGGISAYSGTSQASPHVAGLAVLAQQLAMQRLGRYLSPAEFRSIIRDSATPIFDGDDEDDNVANTNADYYRIDALQMAEVINAMPAGDYFGFGHEATLTASDNATSYDFGSRIDLRAPTSVVIDSASDSGISNTDFITNIDNSSSAKKLKFYIKGTRAGDTVSLWADNEQIGSAVALGSGVVIQTDGASKIVDGTILITSRQQFSSLLVSSASTALALTIDTIAPATPSAPDLAAASDSGRSSTDDITRINTPTFNVAASPYFRFYLDGYQLGDAYNTGSTYTTSPQFEGRHSYALGAVDAAGNEAQGAVLNVTIDTIAPNSGGLAAPGSFDAAFGTGGKIVSSNLSHDESITGLAQQADGKIIAVGTVLNASGVPSFGIARYNTNGSLDTTFGTGGKVVSTIRDRSEAYAVALQSDGKIIVSGAAGIITGSIWRLRFTVARYNTDGSLDTTFGTGGSSVTPLVGDFSSVASSVKVQSDDKIVAAGYGFVSDFDTDYALMRYNADGSLDSTFDGDGKLAIDLTGHFDTGEKLIIQSDGKYVVGGDTDNASNNASWGVARINPDGTFDTTFDGDGKWILDADTSPFYRFAALTQQSDGKLLVTGNTTSFPGAFAIKRLNTDGSLDASFGTSGTASLSQGDGGRPNDIAVQSDGKIVVSGFFYNYYKPTIATPVVARFDVTGTLDTSFGSGGLTAISFGPYIDNVNAMLLQSNGKIVLGGGMNLQFDTATNHSPGTWALARINGGSVVALSAPDLLATSDSGLSNTDNITNDDTPSFVIPLYGNDATRLYRGSTIIADYAQGADLTPSASQPNGTANYSTAIVDAAGNELRSAATLAVTIDTIAPTGINPLFNRNTLPQQIRWIVSENLTSTLSAGSLTLTSASNNTVAADSATYLGGAITFRFNSQLPNGKYTATLGISDVAGNPISAPSLALQFMTADGNNNGTVEIGDFNLLATNFGKSGQFFQQGNYDYSADGRITIEDFNILAANFGKSVPASTQSRTSSGSSGSIGMASAMPADPDSDNPDAEDLLGDVGLTI